MLLLKSKQWGVKPPKGLVLTPNFTIFEAACRCCGRVASVEAVQVTAAWLESVRAVLGRPIRVLSWCRCPKHNKAVGGAKDSYHMKGVAVDIACKDMSPEEVRKRLAPYRGHGRLLDGGLGAYEGFNHLDRGPFRNWTG